MSSDAKQMSSPQGFPPEAEVSASLFPAFSTERLTSAGAGPGPLAAFLLERSREVAVVSVESPREILFSRPL